MKIIQCPHHSYIGIVSRCSSSVGASNHQQSLSLERVVYFTIISLFIHNPPLDNTSVALSGKASLSAQSLSGCSLPSLSISQDQLVVDSTLVVSSLPPVQFQSVKKFKSGMFVNMKELLRTKCFYSKDSWRFSSQFFGLF